MPSNEANPTDQTPNRPIGLAERPGFFTLRIAAMIRRYWYLIRTSWPRIFSLMYWPTVSMMLWGFIQTYIASQAAAFAVAVSFLIGAVLLWDIMFRGQLGFSVSFLEEVWSRNLGHLLVSPLRPIEFVVALMVSSLIRSFIAVIPASALAIWLFDFSIFSLGPALGAFFVSLILFGWSLALIVAGLVLRYGQSAEEFAWALVFALQPFVGVYYPTSVLPGVMQWVSVVLPPKYVFDGLRAILIDQRFDFTSLAIAFGLNAVYFLLGFWVFFFFLDQARDKGMLLQVGE